MKKYNPDDYPPQYFLQDVFLYLEGSLYWILSPNARTPVGTKAASIKLRNGFLAVPFRDLRLFEHTLIWILLKGDLPANYEVYHKNGIKTDNQIHNLDIRCTADLRGTTEHRGVHYVFEKKKWKANFMLNGKMKYAGYYNTVEEAVEGRKLKMAEHGLTPT